MLGKSRASEVVIHSMAFLEALAVRGPALGGHPTGYIDGFFACARYVVDLSRSWDSMSVMLRVGSFDFERC